MKTLETNDWMILNGIIYKIYTMEDFTLMRQTLLEQLKLVIDFDSADFYLSSFEDGKTLVQSVTYNCESNVSSKYNELDYSKGILYSGKSIVYRETDLLPDEQRIKTDYYKKVYAPNNWHYAIQMILAYQKEFLGVITLYRTISKEDFNHDDVFVLDVLKEHLAYRLYTQRMKTQTEELHRLTVEEMIKCYDLTRREGMVLSALSECKPNEQISEEFGISVNTLKKHILNIYRKVGVNNRVQLFGIMKRL